jgi:hypothetical protein
MFGGLHSESMSSHRILDKIERMLTKLVFLKENQDYAYEVGFPTGKALRRLPFASRRKITCHQEA